jgi:succinate-acetate transporter protein
MEAASVHPQDPTRSGDIRADPQPATGWKPADPGPLGLAAFAMTTFVLSMFNSNLVDAKGVPVVLGLALAYGGIVQLLAGMWEFRTGNTFGAVAFCSFGAFWISFWALNVFYAKQIGGNAGHAVGVYLWAWAIFTAYMTVAAMRTSGAVLLVFVLLTVTFILLAIGTTGAHETVTHLGGFVGLATAAAAWYASFAVVTNSTFGRTVLPVIPLGRS